ncbi:MAG: 2-polyprenyl-3-methyl-6-methoxy-1,4-benzoquinone monooxygenase [Nitrospira sp.]|jgi:ubiquinone biosynthesis monooxygenase Coq7|nr:2-polyprenyl-3-methyl-6-methoxy-1,4-benzoquinone monooxygenase [Nitrospira sp.]
MFDGLILEFDKALRTVFAPGRSVRPIPGSDLPEAVHADDEKRHVAALMRVNHCGEICAQALYQGQTLASRSNSIRTELHQASAEEGEHLAWTEHRIAELGGRKSLLNPLWYAGSLTLGVIAGKLGDAWNLGFLAETERQVESHLNRHLQRLSENDRKSWAILEQMKADEIGHSNMAERLGARELPSAVKLAMKLASGVMTRTAYWV